MGMKSRYRLYRRNAGVFYSFDKVTGKRESLQTFDAKQAASLIDAKNEGHEQQAFNRQKARIYFSASDPNANTRTWKHVMDEITKTKNGETRERYERAFLDKALTPLNDIPLVQTSPEAIVDALEAGTVATNVFLRRLHNFAVRMHWLPQALIYCRSCG